ncbi:MAG TPA: transposase [Baekduia sp.]|nr:transposase [Baekduia sp.]
MSTRSWRRWTGTSRRSRAHPGCRALMRHYGIGPQVACAILAELGDTRRFSSSR